MTSPKPIETLYVKVHSPFVVYFDGEATSVSAVNRTGTFDILPQHHKFLTLLSRSDLVVRLPDGTAQNIPINGGMMHVKEDQVIVFLNI
jgi:F0F1-type ATP synthase epsilon subunit